MLPYSVPFRKAQIRFRSDLPLVISPLAVPYYGRKRARCTFFWRLPFQICRSFRRRVLGLCPSFESFISTFSL